MLHYCKYSDCRLKVISQCHPNSQINVMQGQTLAEAGAVQDAPLL